jgi:diaminopimelate epimerase
MAAIRFAKMSGAANDFVVIDNRGGAVANPTAEWVAKVCRPRYAVGADGLMLLGPSADADFTMRYFNADGSEAAMCGNGGRCIARFAVLVGAAAEGRDVKFVAPSGVYTAQVQGDRVRLELPGTGPAELGVKLPLAGGDRECDFINTGVPHAVCYTDQVEKEDVRALGREIRRHARFAPAGTNVNFVQVAGPHELKVRTYERGVEDETLACGTGAAAAVLCAAQRGRVESPVLALTQSGLALKVEFARTPGGFAGLAQSGEARLVYWGELSDEATRFDLK